MDFQTAVRTCFSRYATFSGRAPRSEFWWFFLFSVLSNTVVGILDSILFGHWFVGHGYMMGEGASPLSALWSLVLLLPSLAVGARRLHDTGRSGWWLLLSLIPLIGMLVLLWWFTQAGDVDDNEYGPDPLRRDGGGGGPVGPSSVPRVNRNAP